MLTYWHLYNKFNSNSTKLSLIGFMRDFSNSLFDDVVKRVVNKEQSLIGLNVTEAEFTFLQYHLTRHFYYAVIIDDYSFEIVDKASLLEALYYQTKLVTIHGLNWDALQEGLENLLHDDLINFEGICLLFRNKGLKVSLSREIDTLIKIIEEINKQSKQKRINILIN